jgi:hypothetical protein
MYSGNGGVAVGRVDLAERFRLPSVGTYRARLHHGHGPAHRLLEEARGPIDGWICSTSEEFTIRVRTRTIALPKEERRRLRERFDSIDLSKPRLLPALSLHWSPDDVYAVPPRDPVDELYRAGWSAVPVLLDVLDEPGSSLRARAWALALLADITGRNGREYARPELDHAFGWIQWYDCWPGKKEHVEEAGLVTIRNRGALEPVASYQEELIRRWTADRANLVVHE